MTIQWRIPLSTLYWLDKIPKEKPVAVLLRHSVREPLPADNSGYAVPINETGAQLAHQLGVILGRRLQSLHASPVPRCMQTAEALRNGSAAKLPVIRDNLLGDPGVFVLDDQQAWQNWLKFGHDCMMAFLVNADSSLPGMADPKEAARFLIQHILDAANTPGIHIFVTHDSVLAGTALQQFGQTLERTQYPWYLEGAFFWIEEGIQIAYRDLHCVKPDKYLLSCRDSA
ncbi:MAG: histidine phosphatase family protein [Gammaproteobacteria bacterium]|nr:histidine phosphatase family protein [Gammaproteobacteria bacterium]